MRCLLDCTWIVPLTRSLRGTTFVTPELPVKPAFIEALLVDSPVSIVPAMPWASKPGFGLAGDVCGSAAIEGDILDGKFPCRSNDVCVPSECTFRGLLFRLGSSVIGDVSFAALILSHTSSESPLSERIDSGFCRRVSINRLSELPSAW